MAASIFSEFSRFSSSLNDKYEPYIRQHLSQVYMVLGGTTAVCALGAIMHLKNLLSLGTIAAIGSLILVLALHFYRDDGKNYYTRLGMLLGFGFCSGQSLGPLLQYIMHINPSIIVTALVGTMIIFLSLSLAALFAPNGKFLCLGGMLISVINTMAILSLFNIFFKSYFVQLVQLYVGVFVMAGFILFDTHNIIAKCHLGNRDVVQHALDLFFDVLSMFRRLLIILTQKEERKRDERRKNQ